VNVNTNLRHQEANLGLIIVSFTSRIKVPNVVDIDVLHPRYRGSKFPPDDRLKDILWEFSGILSISYGKC